MESVWNYISYIIIYYISYIIIYIIYLFITQIPVVILAATALQSFVLQDETISKYETSNMKLTSNKTDLGNGKHDEVFFWNKGIQNKRNFWHLREVILGLA